MMRCSWEITAQSSGFPCSLPDDDAGFAGDQSSRKGELYDITESQLPLLDALESVGLPGNFRKSIKICQEDDGLAGWAFCI
jgi:gamma-glutamylcyclotransferase (GGCT)/AIG2-like uncharacterized protein YtfP